MARLFDGDNDVLETTATTSDAVDLGTSDFSITFQYKNNIAFTNGDRFFCKGTSSGGTGGGVRYEAFYNSGSISFTVDDNSTKSEAVSTAPSEFTDGSWHSMIFERDQSTHLKIFADATEKISGGDGTGSVDNGNTLLIGAGRGGSDTIESWGEGTFAEFAIFRRLLTASEKAILAAGYSPLFLNPGPDYYQPLHGSNSPETDYISGDSMTVTGAVQAAHPRIIYPTSKQIRWFSSSAVANTRRYTLTLTGVG